MSKMSRKILVVAAAASLGLGASAPAFAGGGHGHHSGNGYGYNYGHSSNYYGHNRHYRHGRGRHGSGDAALVALGIVGGLILLDAAIDDNRRYNDRRYDDTRYYDRRSSGRYNDRRADSRYQRTQSDPYGYRDRAFGDRDDGYYGDNEYYEDERAPGVDDQPVSPDDGLDFELEGGEGASAAITTAGYSKAFDKCSSHARSVMLDRGMMVAAPSRPASAVEVKKGTWRMKADFSGQTRRNGRVVLRMTCDADSNGVRRLELI